MAKDQIVEIAGKQVRLSNLDKVLYPAVGFTKAQVIDYFVRIAPVLLPHLKNRPLTLKRYPEGVDGMFFYEKTCPKHRPEWVQTAQVWSEGRGDYIPFCLANDLPTLVWAGNLADLELHTSLSVAKDVMRPTMMVFDLDPGPPANIVQCCRVGLWVRDLFAKLGMESFAKTSGSKGLQVYIPLNTPVTYDDTKPFAHAVARLLEDEHPEEVVSDMKKALRVNKVLVDWSQNDDHKTTVCVYSLRPDMLVLTTEDTVRRAEKLGDIFAPVLTLKQRLPKAKELSEHLATEVQHYTSKLRPTVARKGRAKKAEEKTTKKKRTPLQRKTV